MELKYENKTLKVAFFISTYLPFINVSNDGNSSKIAHYNGLLVELLDKLAAKVKFKYEIVQQIDKSYGVFANGSWDGLVGMLHRNEVDIAAAPLTITEARNNVIDFSYPFAYEWIGLLIRVPERKKSLWNMIFVFSVEVWLSLLISTIGVVIFVRVICYFDFATLETRATCTLQNCVWLIYGGLLNQICIISAKSWSNRIFQLCWRISAVLLISTYAGCLIAALTTERLYLPFTDLKGLVAAVQQNEYKICVPNMTAFYTAIMTSPSIEYQTLKNWLQVNRKFATSDTECVYMLRTMDNVAVPEEVTYLENFQAQYCDEYPTILLADKFFPGYLALGFRKRSGLNLLLSKYITELVENGFVEKWKKKYSRAPKFCDIKQADSTTAIASVKQLVLEDVGGLFLLFLLGLVVASIAFFIERISARNQHV